MIKKANRFLIVNADDLGLSAPHNEAIFALFQAAAVTSASLMVPGAEAAQAVKIAGRLRIRRIGIHLTLTSTMQEKLRPVYAGKTLRSLTDEAGFFPRDAAEVERRADPEEVRLELEAQILQAISWGLAPTHLDTHAGSVLGLSEGRDFLGAVFELCRVHGLPFNLPRKIIEQPFLSEAQKLRFGRRLLEAKRLGIGTIDDLIGLPYTLPAAITYEAARVQLIQQLRALPPGVTQWTVHPAVPSDPSLGREREQEYRLLLDPLIRKLLEEERIELLNWSRIPFV